MQPFQKIHQEKSDNGSENVAANDEREEELKECYGELFADTGPTREKSIIDMNESLEQPQLDFRPYDT